MTSIKKIDLVDCPDIFLVCCYNSKQLHITVLDNEKGKAFSGNATDVELRLQAATLRMTFSDFIDLTLKALGSKTKVDSEKFLYCLEQNCKSFLFRWKSIDQDETIINIGCITLAEQDYKSVTNSTFSKLSVELSGLNEEIENKKQTISKLSKEKEEHLRLVTDMSEMKERLETELYSKFILILNEKKRKIKEMKEKGTDTSLNNRKRIKPVLPKKTHQISDSSDEEICDQDIRNIPGPSKAKHNASLMFFDDEDPPVSTSPSKKRTRHKTTETKASAFEVKKAREPSPVVMESEDEDELFKHL